MAKGQASAEYLLLSLVALMLLSFSVSALLSVKDSSEKTAAMLEFRQASSSLGNAIREVCALGGGNSREMSLGSGAAISVEAESYTDGWLVRLTPESAESAESGYSSVHECPCKVEPADGLEGVVKIKNEGGVISVSTR